MIGNQELDLHVPLLRCVLVENWNQSGPGGVKSQFGNKGIELEKSKTRNLKKFSHLIEQPYNYKRNHKMKTLNETPMKREKHK